MFGRRTRVDPRPEVPVKPAARGLWADGFGQLATRALQTIIVLVLSAGVIIAMRQLSVVIIPIILALIFASTLWPLTKKLRARGLPGALIATIELVGIVIALGLIGWLIVWTVIDQWDDLASQAQDGFEQLLAWVRSLPFAPNGEQLSTLIDEATKMLQGLDLTSGAAAGVGAVTSFFTGLVLMVVVLFFFLKDGPQIWNFVLRPFDGAALRRAQRAGERTVYTLGSYVRGTATVALVDAVGIGIGLLILGVPLAVPLAVLVFLLAFIPLVGATLAGTLAALVALVANGPVAAFVVVGIVVLVNQLEGNFLQPVVMGRALKLHPLVILLALTVGTVLAGILGAVLAVPIAAVVWSIIQVWDGPDLPAKAFRAKPREME